MDIALKFKSGLNIADPRIRNYEMLDNPHHIPEQNAHFIDTFNYIFVKNMLIVW